MRNVNELKSREIKDTLVSDTWWNKVNYILIFTKPIILFLRDADIVSSVLHFVYDMWDIMIEDVRGHSFEHENEDWLTSKSVFYAIQKILEDRWDKSNTPLYSLAHSRVQNITISSGWKEGVMVFVMYHQMRMNMCLCRGTYVLECLIIQMT